MKKHLIISIFFILLMVNTVSAELYIADNNNVIVKDDWITQILKVLTIQGSLIRSYTVEPNAMFPITYQNCPFQGLLGNNEVASRIVIILSGVIVYDTGVQSVTPGICYNPVTVSVKAPAVVGTYYGYVRDYMTMDPPAQTSQDYAITVTVVALTPVATSVVVTPLTATINPGGTYTLSGNVYDQFGANMIVTPIWTSSNNAIVTVSVSGVVTGVNGGTATITATYGGKSGSALITVTTPIAKTITVSPSINTINIGDNKMVGAIVKDQFDNIMSITPTWSSENTAIASVNTGGLVTGTGIGITRITATSGTASGSAIFTVNAPGVTILPPNSLASFLQAIWTWLRTIFPFLPINL